MFFIFMKKEKNMSEKLENGNYTVEVALEGGSGKSTIESPAKLTVEDGKVQAEIVWSSSNYDYMKVNDKEYYPVNMDGNSTFLIDVEEFDCVIPVLAETIAMSEPHMIEYTLYFDSETIKSEESQLTIIIPFIAITVVILMIIGFMVKKEDSKWSPIIRF